MSMYPEIKNQLLGEYDEYLKTVSDSEDIEAQIVFLNRRASELLKAEDTAVKEVVERVRGGEIELEDPDETDEARRLRELRERQQ